MTLNETLQAGQGLVSGVNIQNQDIFFRIGQVLQIISGALEKAVLTIKNFIPEQYTYVAILGVGLAGGYMVGVSLNKSFTVIKATLLFGLLLFLLFAFAGGNL